MVVADFSRRSNAVRPAEAERLTSSMISKLKHLIGYMLHVTCYMVPTAALADEGLFGLDATAQKAGLKSSVAGPATAAGTIVGYFLAFIGVVFFVLMIYGGLLWMTARGSEEMIKKAQELIKSAILGMIIVFLSYAITQFVLSRLTSAVGL